MPGYTTGHPAPPFSALPPRAKLQHQKTGDQSGSPANNHERGGRTMGEAARNYQEEEFNNLPDSAQAADCSEAIRLALGESDDDWKLGSD
ncbi:MAG: hypothetical protein Kow00100_24510 [Geothermobacteraceae bacterium]